MNPTYGPAAAEDAVNAPAAESVLSDPAASGLRRLSPADGLFLRAEHLDQIQDYAATLGRLSALTGGGGTVAGYDLELSSASGETSLVVSAGLAVSGRGRLLRSTETLTVGLGELEVGEAGEEGQRFWVVEGLPAVPGRSGDEPAYSSVCATSCGPGATIHPWLDERVAVRVRAISMDLPWNQSGVAYRRSALASAWFERERRLSGPWLTPVPPDAVVPALATRNWSAPTPASEPDADAVPLALLYRADGQWRLDVWAARRDRMEGPPEGGWLGHFSMRPWRVFVAQILQFEAQAAALLRTGEPLAGHLVELPPGGFVDIKPGVSEGDKVLAGWFRERFGDNVNPKVHRVTPDEAVRRVSLAQHLDRIPLQPTSDRRPLVDVDVWVPSVRPDLAYTRAEYHPAWVAFTHVQPDADDGQGDGPVGRPAGPVTTATAAVEPDEVPAYLLDTAPSRRDRRAKAVTEALKGKPTALVGFDVGRLAVRPGQPAVEDLRHKIGARKVAYVVASTAEPERASQLTALGMALATALGAAPGAGTVHAVPREDGPDAIIVMVPS